MAWQSLQDDHDATHVLVVDINEASIGILSQLYLILAPRKGRLKLEDKFNVNFVRSHSSQKSLEAVK